MNDLISALQIFAKYGNPHNPTHCEHDVLQVSIDYKKVSPEDIQQLKTLGFIPDEDYDCFKSYRFGSC